MKLFIKILAPFLVVLYTCFEIYFNNIGEAVVTDIFPIILALILIVSFMIIIFMLIFKNIYKSVFMVTIVTLVSLNFKSIIDVGQPLLPNFYYWHFILFFIYLVCLLTYILRKYQFKEIGNINSILSIVFAFFILYSTVIAFPKIIDLNKKLKNLDTADIVVKTNIPDVSEKPNFYYIIFDEYGGYENLKYFFSYDNHDFYEKIKNLGFNVSYSSRNYNIETIKIISDLVNFKNVSLDDWTYHLYKEYVANPPLVQIFKEYGYKLNKITNDPIGLKSHIDYKNNVEKSTTETVYGMLVYNSILYPLNFNISDNYLDNLNSHINYLYNSIRIKDNGILSIGHFGLPHLPFVFDKDGNKNPNYMYSYIEGDEPYLNQLEYTNKVIEKYVSLIRENDPNAVVLIQSDHGCRLVQQRNAYLGQRKPTTEEIEYMKSILNILYFKGEKIDIEGLSGYDTLKLVVDKILNTNLYEGQIK